MTDTNDFPNPLPADFASLATSRRSWIDAVLRPWCRQAPLQELRKAEQEWFDIAGRADIAATLWTWAWERFGDIIHPDLPGVHETHEVRVTLHDGTQLTGFPDARQSLRGNLVIVGTDSSGTFISHKPVTIDQVVRVERVQEHDESASRIHGL